MRISNITMKIMFGQEMSTVVMTGARRPCAVCGKGVRTNSIQCCKCLKWLPKNVVV